jgi:hypothetical protein
MFSSLISSVVFSVVIITSSQPWSASAAPAPAPLPVPVPLLALNIEKVPGTDNRVLSKSLRAYWEQTRKEKRSKKANSPKNANPPQNATVVTTSASKTNGTKVSTVGNHKSSAAPSSAATSSVSDSNSGDQSNNDSNTDSGNQSNNNSNSGAQSNSNSNSNSNAQPFVVPNPLPNPNNAPAIGGSGAVTFSNTFLQLSTANPISPPYFDLASSSGADQAGLNIAMVGYINASPADAANFAYTLISGDVVDAYGILDMDFQCGMISADIWSTLGAAINVTLSSCTFSN